MAEGLRSATFLGIVSWRQSRCQLPNDPKGWAKECGLGLEALGRHKSLLSREQPDHIWAVRVLGGRGEGKGRSPNLRPGRFPLGGSHQRPTIQKVKRGEHKEWGCQGRKKGGGRTICGPRLGFRMARCSPSCCFGTPK